MPTLRRPLSAVLPEDFLAVGSATEATASGDVAAGDSTSTLVFKAADAKLEVKRTSGALIRLGSFSELVTIGTGATTYSIGTVPAYATMYAISAYVVTTVPDATHLDLQLEGIAATYVVDSFASSAGSSNLGNSGCPRTPGNSSASRVAIIPNITPSASAGEVRLVVYWYLPIAPTS